MSTARVSRCALALGILALAAVALLTGANPSSAGGRQAGATPARLNVVVIETDDQTAASLRVMPNVQRLLGAEGATFETSFATWPLCCPSRATFLTGQYAHNHGVLGNSPPDGGYDRLDHSNTLAVWLQRAGYHTALVGKYLNGYATRGRALEIPPGWSEWHATVRGGFLGQTLNENGRLVSFGETPADYSTDVLANRTVDVIRRRAPLAQPFFVWYTPHAPHSGRPVDPDDPPQSTGAGLGAERRGVPSTSPAPRHRDRFGSLALPLPPSFNETDVSDKPAFVRESELLTPETIAAIREAYQQRLESLLAVDDAVAAIVKALQAAGELESTLLVFTSDNGFMHGEHRLPARKNYVYEPSVRVPLVLRGPGIPRGVRLEQLVGNIDLAPTILDAANATAGRRMDGRSLLPLAANPKLAWRSAILLERSGSSSRRRGEGRNPPFAAIRTPGYVYVEYESGERELYDLNKDPHQLTSRHADPAFAKLRSELARRLAALERCAGTACG